MKVELADQVVRFIGQLAPEPRRRVRLALRRLEQGKGDVKTLEGELSAFCSLRIGNIRIILRYDGPKIRCEFAEHRSLVYEVYSAMARQMNP